MHYSHNLQKYVEEIELIISKWPVDINLEKVIKWILQFDASDFDLAMRIIRNLNVIGANDIDYLLEIAYSKLNRKAIERGTRITSKNTIFAGMGEDGKSGSMISYHFRIINDISEENFLSEDSIKYFEKNMIENIVLIDDILLSGNQASKIIREYTEQFIPLGVKNIFVLTVAGYREGTKKVEDTTSAYVFSAYEFGIEDTYAWLDSKFYDGIPYEMRVSTKRKMEQYGSICSPKMPNGYAGLCALVAFYYNTPNATSPLIWSSGNGWIPLFKRAMRINGVESYYKQLQKIHEKNVENKLVENKLVANTEPIEVINKELTIYTEGKRDEMLFELLISDFDFKKLVGFNKITIIPLGGGYYSSKLFKKICDTEDNAIFIFDEDMKRLWDDTEKPEYFPVILMSPSILLQCLNIPRICDEYLRLFMEDGLNEYETKMFSELKESIMAHDYETKDIRMLEKLISTKGKSDKFIYIVHEYFNNSGYDLLIKDIRDVLAIKYNLTHKEK